VSGPVLGLVNKVLTVISLFKYCLDVGFYKEKDISFAHKHSNVMKIKRDSWQAPFL
jgi:hypothetical protein